MRGPRHAVVRNRVIRRTGARSQVRAKQEILTSGLTNDTRRHITTAGYRSLMAL